MLQVHISRTLQRFWPHSHICYLLRFCVSYKMLIILSISQTWTMSLKGWVSAHRIRTATTTVRCIRTLQPAGCRWQICAHEILPHARSIDSNVCCNARCICHSEDCYRSNNLLSAGRFCGRNRPNCDEKRLITQKHLQLRNWNKTIQNSRKIRPKTTFCKIYVTPRWKTRSKRC